METTSDYQLIQIILVFIIGITGLLLIVWAGSHLRKQHAVRCCLGAGCGGILIALSLAFLLLISNLYTYERMTHEQVLATVHLQQLAEQHFLVSLDFTEHKPRQIFELKGDEWQIDARLLKWKYPMIWLGLDSHYQFERISGRYTDIASERERQRTVYNLAEHNGPDVWPIIREYQQYIPLVDAMYGTASYLPMRDGAEYELSLTQTGLIARAKNTQAADSISNWH